MEFARIETASSKDIQRYLDKGWKVIEKTISGYPGEGSDITYHVGYPLENRMNDLLELINLYEVNGFKEQLFEKIASNNGEDIVNFKISDYVSSSDEVSKILSKYESVVNNKDVLFKKLNTDPLPNVKF